MSRLARNLKLQRGEGGKVLHFSALNALLHCGVAIGITLTDALFLSELGVERLPYIYLFTPVVMLGYVVISSRLQRRWGVERAFGATLVALAVGILGLYLAAGPGAAPAVYFIAKFVAVGGAIALYTYFWTFADAFFDIQDGKRLFSLFSAGGAAGAVAGGLLVSAVSGAGYVEPLFIAWGALTLLTLPLLVSIGRKHTSLDEDEGPAPAGSTGRTAIPGGSYLPLFAASIVATLVLAAIAEYQYLAILSAGTSAAELTMLLGRLYAVAGVLNLVVNLFLFNRMVLTFGVPSVALITPVAFLIGFTALLAFPGPAAAVMAFLVVQSVLESIDFNNQNFLYNAFPAALKKQIRTVFEGLGEPVATALGGVLLLWAASRLSPAQLSTLGVALSAIAILVVVLLRGGYLRSMVQNLKDSWLDLSQPAEKYLTDLDPREIDSLRARIAEAATLEEAHAAIEILWVNDRGAAVDALLDYLQQADAHALVGSRPLLAMILGERDADVLRRTLTWVTENRARLDAGVLEELGYHGLLQSREVTHLFRSDEPAELGAAVVTAWHSWRPDDRLQAMQTLDRLVTGDGAAIEVGVRATGQLGQPNLAHFIAPYLAHADTGVRRQAIQALRRTADGSANRIVPEILRFIREAEVEADRMVGLEALARIADASCVAPLLLECGDFTPRERREAERVLLRIGLKSVPGVVSALRDPHYPYRGRALAARALGRLALPQLTALSDALIQTEVDRAYRFRHFHRLLSAEAASTPGTIVLARVYGDLQHRIIDFILEILTIGGRLPDFEMLSAGLRSPNPKERGNAIETIEQGVPRALFRELLPLLAPGQGGGPERSGAGSVDAVADPGEILATALDSPFALEAAAAAQALWERDGDAAVRPLRDRLTGSAPSLLRDTIVALLLRTGSPDALNPIERVHALATSPFFSQLRVSELELLARDAVERATSEGEMIHVAGTPASDLYLIHSGEVRVGGRVFGPREVIGAETVFGSAMRSEDAISAGALLLVLAGTAVEEAIGTYPSIGVELLRQRLQIENGATITH